MNFYKKILLTITSLLFFTTVQVAKAQQNFPIISNLQLTPPNSLYLSDYSQVGSNKLQLSLFLRDLTKNNYPCKVNLKIEGFGITISSNPNISTSPIYLNAGQLKVITGDELYPYLNPANLIFQGLSYAAFQSSGGKLPEGVYRITFEVKDYYNNKLVANDATTVLSAFLSYPPFINLPLPNTVVNSLDPQNVLFQWTPRHTASINAAYNVAYKFTLVELTPPDRDPNNAIQTTAPIYETFTDQTFMVYGPGQPSLTKGNSYALKVQAVEASGRDMFINDGNSEVVKFTYGNACETPVNVFAELANQGALKVSWLPWPGQDQFSIRYRERNVESAAWFDQTVTQPYADLTGLRAGAVYEFQVKSVCAGGNAAYSALQWFQIPTEDMMSGDLVCGTAQSISAGTAIPLGFLAPGMFFQAGSFPITVTEVSGAGGIFSGKGTVGIPFLDVSNFLVTFQGVSINTDLKMYAGVVHIATQQLDASQEQLAAAITITPDANGNVTAIYSNGLPNIVKVTIPSPAELPVYNPVNNTLTFTAIREGQSAPQTITIQLKAGDQPPYVFQDKNGETYEVSKNANGTVAVTKRDKQPINSMMAGVEKTNKPVDQSGGNNVVFSANSSQKYGFDTFNAALKNNALYNKNYNPLNNGAPDDRAHWKSVESGRGDVLTATLNGGLIADSLQFKNGNGERIGATRSGNTFTINVIGAPEANEKEIYAYYPSGTAGDAGKNLGKINIASFNNIHKKLVIVPVNGADIGLSAAALKTELDKIYQQAVVDWEVSIAPNFSFDLGNDGLEAGDSNALSAYTAEQNALGKAYKAANGLADNTYYLFVVNNFTLSDQEGYMVRGGQIGFIKAGTPNIIKTTAHELGHGAFNLEHSWELYGVATKNTTSNLMDYNGGTELWYRQWTYMRNPDWVFRPFEGNDEGALMSFTESKTYITPAGTVIKLPANHGINSICIKSDLYPNGSLLSFKVYGKTYTAKIEGSSGGHIFRGYFEVLNSKWGEAYTDSYTYNKGKIDVTVIAKLTETTGNIYTAEYDVLNISTNQQIVTSNTTTVSQFNLPVQKPNTVAIPITSTINCENNASDYGLNLFLARLKNGIKVTIVEAGKPNQEFDSPGENKGAITLKKDASGKWTSSVTLSDNLRQKRFGKASDKAATEKAIKDAIDAKINNTGAGQNVKWQETTTDGGEFLQDKMNLPQWASVIADVGISVFEEAAMPKSMWDQSDPKYASYPVHAPPMLCGVGDGAIEEITEIPQLVKLGVEVASDKQKAIAIWNSVRNLNIQSIKNAATGAIKAKWDAYANSQPYITYHELGKDGFQVATIIYGGFLTKGKNLAEAVEESEDLITKKADDAINSIDYDLAAFESKALSQKIDEINASWAEVYPRIFVERKKFEDMMGEYRYTISGGWKHTDDIASNFKGVDFYKDYFEVAGSNLINTKTAVSMKTTVTTNVSDWLNSDPIKKNLQFLEEGLSPEGLSSNGKIMKITEFAEIHIYMPKSNITPALKIEWMNKLNATNPKIKFEIKALEDFIE